MRWLYALTIYALALIASAQGMHARADDAVLDISHHENIREALGPLAADFIDPSIQDSPHPKDIPLTMQSMLTSEHLLSWLLLADASDNNPLLSTKIRELRDRPECLRKVILALVDRDLSTLKTRGQKQSVLAFTVDPSHYDPIKWTQPGSDPTTNPNAFMLYGTRSVGARNGVLSGQLRDNVNYFSDLFSGNRDEQTARLAEVENAACPNQVSLQELLDWTDLSADAEAVSNTQHLDPHQWKQQLDQLTQSMQLPQFKKKPEPAPDLNTSEGIDRFVRERLNREPDWQDAPPGNAGALRPLLGRLLDRNLQSPGFYPVFFDLLFDKLWDGKKGVMTPKTCTAAHRVLEWANLVGLQISPFPEIRKKEGVRLEHLKASYEAIIAMGATMSAGRPEWISCLASLGDLNQLWNGQIQVQGLMGTLANGLKDHPFSEVRAYSPIWDGPDLLGWGIRSGFGAVWGVGRAFGDLFKETPYVYAQILKPEEWIEEGKAPPQGFAFKVKGVSGLTESHLRDKRFDPKMVQTQEHQALSQILQSR